MVEEALPDRGSVIWLDFSPSIGHEQRGRRPAVVLSRRGYHSMTGMALVAPVTSKKKNFRFEVPIPRGCGVDGVVLCDQVRVVDLNARGFDLFATLPVPVTDAILRTVRFILS